MKWKLLIFLIIINTYIVTSNRFLWLYPERRNLWNCYNDTDVDVYNNLKIDFNFEKSEKFELGKKWKFYRNNYLQWFQILLSYICTNNQPCTLKLDLSVKKKGVKKVIYLIFEFVYKKEWESTYCVCDE